MSVTLDDITRYRIVPVVVLNDAANAPGLGDALIAGGLPIAEVTFRTAAAADSIRTLVARGDLLVGAAPCGAWPRGMRQSRRAPSWWLARDCRAN